MKIMKIAMIQMLVHPGEITQNLKHAEELIIKATKLGCDCVVLPECLDIGWANEEALDLVTTIPGKTTDILCEIAKSNYIYIVAGITEKDHEKFYNTAVLISNKGELLGKHRKIHLVGGVEDIFEPGESLKIFNTPFGKIGITICADNLMDTIAFGQSLAHMGAKMILSPSSWAVSPEKLGKSYGDEWMEPYTLLSSKYNLSIIGVSNVGIITNGLWKGWKCIGNSIAIGNGGELIEVLPYGELAEEIRIINCKLV